MRDKSAVDRDSPSGSRILTLKDRKGLTIMSQKDLRSVNQHVRMWDENFVVQMSVVKGPEGNRDFCSGLNLQDIRGPRQKSKARHTLEALARLVTSMRLCRTPLLSIITGPSYGMAGYALASGRYRVCTEKSMFCIPEASLGLGLASGLSFVLPRLLDGHKALGLCLALTGMALRGADLFSAQLASQYFTTNSLPALVGRMLDSINMRHNPFEKEDKNNFTGAGRAAVLNMIEQTNLLSWNLDNIEENEYYEEGADGKPVTHNTPLHGILPEVKRCFSGASVEEIVYNLERSEEKWAQSGLASMRRSSPLSLKVMFEQVTRGANLGVQECMDQEFQVNMNLFEMEDFGHAMDTKKSGEPQVWSHSTLEEVSKDEVEAVFAQMHAPRRR